MGERRTVSILLLILCFALVSIVQIGVVTAEPKTIVVPDNYPTITAAIRNAVDGDTIFVKKGTYEEKTLEIDKRLSLIGEDTEFTKINLDPPLYMSPPDTINRSSSWFGVGGRNSLEDRLAKLIQQEATWLVVTGEYCVAGLLLI